MDPDGIEEGRTDDLRLPEGATRLVVLGDPHGDLIGLDLALAREAGPGAAFVSVGDNVGYADGPVSSLMCRALAERGIRSVYGNHEAWAEDGRLTVVSPGGQSPRLDAEALAWCRALPHRLRISAPGLAGPVHVVHTLPAWAYVRADTAERLADLEEAAHVTFCGHSHKPAVYALRRGLRRPKVRRLDPRAAAPVEVPLEPGTRYVVDAGSLARPAGPRRGLRLERATYAVLDLERRAVRLVALDKTARMEAIFREMLDG